MSKKELKKVLIIRFSAIGDIILTSPLIRALKQRYPDLVLHYLSKAEFAFLIESNPFVDKVHSWEKYGGNRSLMHTLANEHFDLIVDLHHNLRTLKVKRALKVPYRAFYKANIEKWLTVRLKKRSVLPRMHIVERYIASLKDFDVKYDGNGLDYFLPEESEKAMEQLPEKFIAGYYAASIGGMHRTKKMPVKKWITLTNLLQLPIVLLGGEAEREEGDEISLKSANNCLNLCGDLHFHESAEIVKNARAVISHDTALMHVAAAFHRPVISLWGNTIPEFGMYPLLPESMSMKPDYRFEIKDLSCRPCSKIGYKACPKGHFKCMELQNEVEIAAAMNKF